MMADEEYEDDLDALARRLLKPGRLARLGPGGAVDHLASRTRHSGRRQIVRRPRSA